MGSVELQSRTQAIETLKDSMNVDACCLSRECQFELLRSAVWGLSAPLSHVHISRVINSTLASWKLLSDFTTGAEEVFRRDIREAMSVLEAAGDLIELGKGYWTSATTRTVCLPNTSSRLIVGGLPCSLFYMPRDAIRFHGPHRHIASINGPIATAIPSESFNSWVKLPEGTLRAWSSTHVEALQLSTYNPNSSDPFEFYIPQFAKRYSPQFKRWYGNAKLSTGRYIARRRRVYGANEFRLVELKSGQITKSCELEPVDVRRLMYAYDFQANNPVRVKVSQHQTNSEWLFSSELPLPEQRAFSAIGKLVIPGDRPYLRRWSFPNNDDMVRSLVSALGMEIA
jgi:hypothetical protein